MIDHLNATPNYQSINYTLHINYTLQLPMWYLISAACIVIIVIIFKSGTSSVRFILCKSYTICFSSMLIVEKLNFCACPPVASCK